MTQPQLYDQWWTEPGVGDKGMEEEHDEFWEKILAQMIDIDLSGKTVLDFGCNRGGFLRRLYDRTGFAHGIGVDLARESVAVAEANKGARPLEYHATTSLAPFAGRFDAATSTAVIYLVQDLKDHARQMFQALKPGGIYYASHPDYVSDAARESLRKTIDAHGSIPMQDHTLDDIAAAFAEAGFRVGIKRLHPVGYMSLPRPDIWYPSVRDRLASQYEHSYAFKMVKPA